MDIMPIFRPPTPPQGGLLFFICLLVFNFTSAQDIPKPEPTSYVLYFQVLSDLGPTRSKNYVNEVIHTLKLSKTKIDKKFTAQSFFDETVFNRVAWNKFSMELNSSCLIKQSNTCLKLAQTRNKYLKEYQKLIELEKKQTLQKEKATKEKSARKQSLKK